MENQTFLLQAASAGVFLFRTISLLYVLVNLAALVFAVIPLSEKLGKYAGNFLKYQVLIFGALLMLLPFYWMMVTAFKDGQTSSEFPPVWTPSRVQNKVPDPNSGEMIAVFPLETARREGQLIRVVPEPDYTFRTIDDNGVSIVREMPNEAMVFKADPQTFESSSVIDLGMRNFRRAWYRPEESSRGEVNFLTYFLVSIITSIICTTGALTTSAFAAFAFARLTFVGRKVLFYVILATMMVPGQVLLIPNFLILSKLNMLDTYAALTVPWLASVFTIFLMRQFFMTIPEDLWDAARIDGSSRFRYLWQVVVPLSKPVFITAGIFDFLANWNSLLWPLIVTSSPTKRTLMVGLQTLNDEAGTEFHILMAASCFAILPVVIMFFFLQRFFIAGIARTGLK